MNRPYKQTNIPIEVLRTVALIADLGSYTKASERLGITQPAITSQVKRFQVLVGGPVFDRGSSGFTLNDRGKRMMPLIRTLLDNNDQILELAGTPRKRRPLRLGLSDLYVERYFGASEVAAKDTSILCDNANDLLRGLSEGYIDVCALLRPSAAAGTVVETWQERFVWVRAPDFALGPGEPVPLVGWPGLNTSQIAISALEENGIAYTPAFSSYDRICRFAAVAAGVGVVIVPEWAVPQGLREANEYYLPPLRPVDAGIMTRQGIKPGTVAPVIAALRSLKRSETPASHEHPGSRRACGRTSSQFS